MDIMNLLVKCFGENDAKIAVMAIDINMQKQNLTFKEAICYICTIETILPKNKWIRFYCQFLRLPNE